MKLGGDIIEGNDAVTKKSEVENGVLEIIFSFEEIV